MMGLFRTLCLLSVLALKGLAEDLEKHDVPQACVSDCRKLISLSAKCENQTSGDSAFNDCVCKDSGAQTSFNTCAACAKQNGFTANDDNDIASLMQDCGLDFDAARVTGASATATTATSTITSVSGSSTMTLTTAVTQPLSSQGNGAAATPSDGTGAAPCATAGMAVLVAGLALGLPALG